MSVLNEGNKGRLHAVIRVAQASLQAEFCITREEERYLQMSADSETWSGSCTSSGAIYGRVPLQNKFYLHLSKNASFRYPIARHLWPLKARPEHCWLKQCKMTECPMRNLHHLYWLLTQVAILGRILLCSLSPDDPSPLKVRSLLLT